LEKEKIVGKRGWERRLALTLLLVRTASSSSLAVLKTVLKPAVIIPSLAKTRPGSKSLASNPKYKW